MNTFRKLRFLSIAIVVGVFAMTAISGCGESGGPDAGVQAKSLDKVKTMRGIFDRAGGDWEKVADAEKAEFEKLAGGAENAKLNWDAMKFGPGAANR